MIGRNDENGVDVFACAEHFAEVVVCRAVGGAIFFVHDLFRLFAVAGIDVTYCNDADLFLSEKSLHIACALVAEADTAEVDFVIRCDFAGACENAAGYDCEGGGCNGAG